MKMLILICCAVNIIGFLYAMSQWFLLNKRGRLEFIHAQARINLAKWLCEYREMHTVAVPLRLKVYARQESVRKVFPSLLMRAIFFGWAYAICLILRPFVYREEEVFSF